MLYGTLNVRDVSLSYADFPFRLTGLSGEVALDGDRATVRFLQGTSGGGSVSLSGFVTLADSPRFNLHAALANVRVRYPLDLTSVLEGNLHLTGSTERAQVGGELVVRHMSPGESFNWLARLGEAAAATDIHPPALASPFAPRVRLDIQVISAPTVRFETRDLRLSGEIDLHIQGTLAAPVEVGTIQIVSGEVVFRGNRYKLDHAYISLTNPYRTQPVLDIEARTRVQRYDLTVNVAGPLDRLKLSYRSDPPLPTTDIVSLLAFGYASQQGEMATRTTQPVQTVGASALLSQALSTQVSGRIQRLFGVSRIKIDPNIGGLGYTAGGARVTVEQQMTRDLTLTYVTTTTQSQQRIIQFEWNLSEKVSLVGVRDHNGILGMELKFRQRFK
jgi:translocation and assembly module TamB